MRRLFLINTILRYIFLFLYNNGFETLKYTVYTLKFRALPIHKSASESTTACRSCASVTTSWRLRALAPEVRKTVAPRTES